MKAVLKLEELSSYKVSVELSSIVYEAVKAWSYLDKQTVGIQLIRAADSVAANIAEGFGRYHKRDKIKFYYNARASVLESDHWIDTASRRSLLKRGGDYLLMTNLVKQLPKEINMLIKLTHTNLKN